MFFGEDPISKGMIHLDILNTTNLIQTMLGYFWRSEEVSHRRTEVIMQSSS